MGLSKFSLMTAQTFLDFDIFTKKPVIFRPVCYEISEKREF